jgi:hypothetical protein
MFSDRASWIDYILITVVPTHSVISINYAILFASSIPDGVIGIFQWHNPSDRTMALGSTQPLTEMSTRCISWGVKAVGA